MKKIEIDALYDEMCALLTRYEIGYNTSTMEYELYKMLVKIQNNWGELTSEE